MKRTILTTFIVLTVKIIIAQSGLIATFNSTHSGRSINLQWSRIYYQKNEFGVGIRYNINRIAHSDDQNNVFLKRQYATNFMHHWGITSFYHRYVYERSEFASAFLFYDLQLSYSKTRNRFFLPVGYDVNVGVLYKEVIDFFGPYTWIEQCVGIGVKSKFSDRWTLYQKIGFGTTLILGKEEKILETYDRFGWEFAVLIQVGLSYSIKE